MFRKLFGSPKTQWLSQSAVSDALERGTEAPFKAAGGLYALSPDRGYAILLRDHAAWATSGVGGGAPHWRWGDYPPERGATGRPLVNVFKRSGQDAPGYWYGLLVPQALRITELRTIPDSGPAFRLKTDTDDHVIPFHKLDAFMWDAMTGEAQTEEDIVARFGEFVAL
ncbi:hypothetical protein [Thioclava pacifica]|uniref:Uncharacterized protein n=1 Tax=Thioclava pacifica DSM 10166 TaxID=1353537 RepID=A0A074JFU6_9RHOB|nr:hypothetical protein [Thioclava pacifica]KEO56496.1 hypothetical protein TP2_02920 [Thioclava pacifica DSM 10166]